MKQIDCTPIDKKASQQGGIEGTFSRLSQSLSRNEAQSQTVMLNALDKVLDHKFTGLLNVAAEGSDLLVPIIVVGPPGIWVINTSSVKGIFRAREENWEELDERFRRYNLRRPNLVEQTSRIASAVEKTLKESSENSHTKPPAVEPVLFFSDPGTHVDSTRPAVRIVLADAAERFAVDLAQRPPLLTQERLQASLAALAGGAVSGEAPGDVSDVFSFRDLPQDKPVQGPRKVIVEKVEPEVFQRVPFNRRQLMWLGLLIVVNLLIITALVVIVLLNS